jgi:hypothetical protein
MTLPVTISIGFASGPGMAFIQADQLLDPAIGQLGPVRPNCETATQLVSASGAAMLNRRHDLAIQLDPSIVAPSSLVDSQDIRSW